MNAKPFWSYAFERKTPFNRVNDDGAHLEVIMAELESFIDSESINQLTRTGEWYHGGMECVYGLFDTSLEVRLSMKRQWYYRSVELRGYMLKGKAKMCTEE